MPYYLLQAAYTPQVWANLVKTPQDRTEAIRPFMEGLGGKIIAGFLAFREYDSIALAEMPDNVSAAAFSMPAAAGGAVKDVKTMPLLTTQEGVEACVRRRRLGISGPRRDWPFGVGSTERLRTKMDLATGVFRRSHSVGGPVITSPERASKTKGSVRFASPTTRD